MFKIMKEITKIIYDARKRGQQALSEYDSLRVLALAGVTTIDCRLVADVTTAIEAAARIGYPVVLKGTGATLLHKTEIGAVRLGVPDADALQKGVREIAAIAGDRLEGFIVAPMVDNKRELIAGFFRDPSFGPAVMFGIGGIAAEALKDVVFRLAPLTAADAREMIGEIKSSALLGAFRGLSAVDREALVRTIVALGRLGVECKEIKEIDINPLLIAGDKPVAVDALVVLVD